jgi:N utilization substance protein B
MQKNRRKSREIALQTLYACDVGESDDCVKVLHGIIDESETDDADAAAYARSLVLKVAKERVSIDVLLAKHAANWDVHRMTVIDRNILRMAVAELTLSQDVPYKVVMDEVVELAKEYGTDDSGKFVNGVIDSIHKEMTKDNKSIKPDTERQVD